MVNRRSYRCVSYWLVAAMVVALVGTSSAAAAGPADNTILIGGNFELSGRFAYVGETVVQGAKLAIKEVNAAGGLLGKKVEFVALDNASEKAKAVVVMKSLAARSDVSAVLGCLTAADTAAAYAIAEQSHIPLISPTASTYSLTGTDGKAQAYAFLTCAADSYQAKVMARFALEELGAKTAAIVFNNRVPISRNMASVFEQTFTNAGGKIVAKEQTGTSEEFSQEFLMPIRNADPEVIFIPLLYREAGQVIRCLREGGIRAPLLGSDTWDSPRIVAYAGEEALNDVYYFAHYASSGKIPKVGKFEEAFAKEYKRPADVFASMGYEAALVLIEAIKKAGSADPESVRTALEGIEIEGLLGAIRIDAANHDVVKAVVINRMIEGQPVPYRLLKP